MRIGFLDAHRGAIQALAAWHYGEWGHLYSDWTLEVGRAELEDHATRRSLPTTLVVHQGDDVLGSVSLVLEDAPEFADEGSPWLASLFVRPEARSRGLGALLVRAAVARAAELEVAELFLFTPGQRGFYGRLGWAHVARTTLKGTPVDLMRIEPATADDADADADADAVATAAR